MDTSSFGTLSDAANLIQSTFGDNAAATQRNLSNMELQLQTLSSNLPIDVRIGTEISQKITTADGILLNVTSSGGELFLNNLTTLGFNYDPTSGKYVDAEAVVNTLTGAVEGSETSYLLNYFSRSIYDSSGSTTLRSNQGVYTDSSCLTLDSTNYTFISTGSDGNLYLGFGYDTISGITHLETSNETLVAISPGKQPSPVTVPDKYENLLYGILTGAKFGLTADEINLINTETYEIASATLKSTDPAISDSEIQSIATSQSQQLINMAWGLTSSGSIVPSVSGILGDGAILASSSQSQQ